jgi:hypothetical protein
MHGGGEEVRYHPWFQASSRGLGTYPSRIKGITVYIRPLVYRYTSQQLCQSAPRRTTSGRNPTMESLPEQVYHMLFFYCCCC